MRKGSSAFGAAEGVLDGVFVLVFREVRGGTDVGGEMAEGIGGGVVRFPVMVVLVVRVCVEGCGEGGGVGEVAR